MPDAAQFTPAFIESFVLTCKDAGLTKEATADLLQVAALGAAHNHPPFAEGFAHRLAVEGGAVEKSAWALAGKALTAGLGVGGVGLGGYMGYKKVTDGIHNHNRSGWSPVPSVGGYDPKASAAAEKAEIAEKYKGVADLNHSVYENDKKRTELQKVIDSNGPGAGDAMNQMQGLRGDWATKKRNAAMKTYDDYGRANAENLKTVEGDLADLNESRGSWWNKTRNFFHVGRDFDKDERYLSDQRAELGRRGRINEKLHSRLQSRSTGPGDPDEIIEPQDLRARFFRTID